MGIGSSRPPRPWAREEAGVEDEWIHEFNDVTPRCECVVCVCAQPKSLATFLFVFLSIYASAHSRQGKCHLLDESPIKPIGLSGPLALWASLNSPILLPCGGVVRFMDGTQATGPLTLACLTVDSSQTFHTWAWDWSMSLRGRKINGLMGRWLWLPTPSPLCSVCLSQRPSSNSHPCVFRLALALKKYAHILKSITRRKWRMTF